MQDKLGEARRRRCRCSARAAVFLVCFSLMPSLAGAQTVRGSILDSATGVGIENAAVTLFSLDSTIVRVVLTDPRGEFVLSAPEPGQYRLQVRQLGYATVVTNVYEVVQDSSLSVELRLEPEAIELPGVVVTAESRWGRDKFSRRRDAGAGVFIGPDQLAALEMYHPGDAFQGLTEEGVRLRWDYGVLDSRGSSARGLLPRVETNLGKGCLAYMLNEVPVFRRDLGTDGRRPWAIWPLSTVKAEDIMGIEIYRHLGEVPAQFRTHAWRPGRFGEETCGLVVIWTKEVW